MKQHKKFDKKKKTHFRLLKWARMRLSFANDKEGKYFLQCLKNIYIAKNISKRKWSVIQKSSVISHFFFIVSLRVFTVCIYCRNLSVYILCFNNQKVVLILIHV